MGKGSPSQREKEGGGVREISGWCRRTVQCQKRVAGGEVGKTGGLRP